MRDRFKKGQTPKKKRWITVSDSTNMEEIAKELGLPSYEKIDDMNLDYYWESAKDVEGDKEREEAEVEARDEVFKNWYDAVEKAAEDTYDKGDLKLVPKGKHERPHEFKIVPKTSWTKSAEAIREIINGVGYFHFGSLREFLSSGPYTAREAVLSHIGYCKDYCKVYGCASPRSTYNRHWR